MRLTSHFSTWFAVCFLLLASSLESFAKPQVVCANPILTELTQALVADAAGVTCLTPVGADPHQYEPAPADLARASKAHLLIVNGLGLEPWSERLLRDAETGQRVLIASKGIHVLGKDASSAHGVSVDPHAWQDPRNVVIYLRNISDALLPLLSKEEQVALSARSTALQASFERLYEDARKRFEALPATRRKIVTSHDALGYFGNAFGIEIVALRGLNPDEEPTARDLARIVDWIRAQQVSVVYLEATSSPKIAELIAKEAGVKRVHTLFTDVLGDAGTPEASTLGMLRSNVAIVLGDLETP